MKFSKITASFKMLFAALNVLFVAMLFATAVTASTGLVFSASFAFSIIGFSLLTIAAMEGGLSGIAGDLSATALAKAVVKLGAKDNNQRHELRPSSYGALSAGMMGRQMSATEAQIESVKQSPSQPTHFAVMKKGANGSATAESCTHSGGEDSALTTLSWGQLVETYSVSHRELAGNYYSSAQEIHDFRLKERTRSLLNRLEAAMITALNGAKSDGAGTFFGARVAGNGSIPLAQYDMTTNREAFFISNTKGELKQNDYANYPIQIIAEPESESRFNQATAQGQGTQTNLGFDAFGLEILSTNSLTKTGGSNGSFFAVPMGNVFILFWIDPLNRSGYSATKNTKNAGTWTEIVLPFDPSNGAQRIVSGIPAGVHLTDSCAGTADYVSEVQLTVNYTIVSAYSSDANSGVYKYDLAAA